MFLSRPPISADNATFSGRRLQEFDEYPARRIQLLVAVGTTGHLQSHAAVASSRRETVS